jgi:hypothetical protein
MDYKDYKLKGQNVVDIPFVCYIIYLRFRSNILANILLLLAEQCPPILTGHKAH